MTQLFLLPLLRSRAPRLNRLRSIYGRLSERLENEEVSEHFTECDANCVSWEQWLNRRQRIYTALIAVESVAVSIAIVARGKARKHMQTSAPIYAPGKVTTADVSTRKLEKRYNCKLSTNPQPTIPNPQLLAKPDPAVLARFQLTEAEWFDLPKILQKRYRLKVDREQSEAEARRAEEHRKFLNRLDREEKQRRKREPGGYAYCGIRYYTRNSGWTSCADCHQPLTFYPTDAEARAHRRECRRAA